LVPFRTFRGPLFTKPVTDHELFFAIYYSKPALALRMTGRKFKVNLGLSCEFEFVFNNFNIPFQAVLKFIYSERATKFCEISTNYLTGST
jgi:hypothetical protein